MERTKFYFAKKKLKSQDFNKVDEFIFAKKYDSSGNSNLYIYSEKLNIDGNNEYEWNLLGDSSQIKDVKKDYNCISFEKLMETSMTTGESDKVFFRIAPIYYDKFIDNTFFEVKLNIKDKSFNKCLTSILLQLPGGSLLGYNHKFGQIQIINKEKYMGDKSFIILDKKSKKTIDVIKELREGLKKDLDFKKDKERRDEFLIKNLFNLFEN